MFLRFLIASLIATTFLQGQNADLSEVCSRVAREAAHFTCQTNQAGNHTTIEVTRSGIINWDDFRVPENHTLEFVFKDSSQWVVNQVTTSARTFVLGDVIANGKFALVNPQSPIEVRSTIRANEAFLSTANVAPENIFAKVPALQFTRNGNARSKVVIEDSGAIISDTGDVTIIASGTLGNDGSLQAARSLRLTTFGDNTYTPGKRDGFQRGEGRGFSFVHRGKLQAGTRHRNGIIEIDVFAMTLNGSVVTPRKGTILVQADSIRNEPGAIYRGPPVSRVLIQSRRIQGALGLQQDDGANPSRLPSLTVFSRNRNTTRQMQAMNPARSMSARPLASAQQRTRDNRRKVLARSTRRFSQVYRQSSQRGAPKPKRR